MMTPTEAVAKRVSTLLKEKNMTTYRLAINSGLHEPTIRKILKLETKSTGLGIIIQLSNGFDMTLIEFLDDQLFDNDNFNF
jgi:transcriptional regulator with XRE-family HTH domain